MTTDFNHIITVGLVTIGILLVAVLFVSIIRLLGYTLSSREKKPKQKKVKAQNKSKSAKNSPAQEPQSKGKTVPISEKIKELEEDSVKNDSEEKETKETLQSLPEIETVTDTEESTAEDKKETVVNEEKPNKKKLFNKKSVSEEEADSLQKSVETMADLKDKKKQRILKEKNSKKKKPDSPIKKVKKAKKTAKKLKIPRTVQESIPYENVYPKDGIIETSKGVFTRSYLLKDINYEIAKQNEQEDMFEEYAKFLKSFDSTTKFQISIIQKNINMKEFEQRVMLKSKNDIYDELRDERNEMIKKKLLEGKNNQTKDKYLTVEIKANNYEEAQTKFARLDNEINTHLKKIGNSSGTVVSTAERLEILHDIYNKVEDGEFCNNYVYNDKGELVPAKEKFSFEIMREMGLTTKDMIAPPSMEFKTDYGKLGDIYFRALFLRTLPTYLRDSVLKELTDTDSNMIASIIFEPINNEKALKMANNQLRNVNSNLIERQKEASRGGYSAELINPQTRDASRESQALVDDLTGNNQNLLYATLVIVHFADSLDKLNSDTKHIMTIGRGALSCDVKKLLHQQENGLNSALPLCCNKLEVKRTITTDNAALFMPFVNQELNDIGGMYYGNNAISHNLILLNRRNLKNGNGFIFGTPGSGKSVSAKQEMMTVLLESDDDVIVLDPEGEYKPMAEMLGGEVIRIAAGSEDHINPFDINMDLDKTDDPIAIKSDFITALCEIMASNRYGLTQTQRSLIDSCIHDIYRPYLNSFDPVTGKYDDSLMPTFHDFHKSLREKRGMDATDLADGLEMYVTGSYNFFAHKTNVKYKERFVVYDIKDIGTNMTAAGLQVALDNVWNRIVEGRKKGKNTWFYIDEIYLLFKTQESATFLKELYKRARKYGGIPTGITQNVTDLLTNETARTMISNCEYILMLNQAPMDRAILGEMLNMSSTEMEYITNASPGTGIIYNGSVKVPFVNSLPKNTKMYKAMTTKLDEVKARDEGKNITEETVQITETDTVKKSTVPDAIS